MVASSVQCTKHLQVLLKGYSYPKQMPQATHAGGLKEQCFACSVLVSSFRAVFFFGWHALQPCDIQNLSQKQAG